ncbi:hypothetical protein EVB81_155 [Rhizobium phage RHph_I46]|uniref:Uncharacterized protein n=1 Tax=Rhizobium phage RHph_I1_9 TaxID=2509729 RepID=A0A7S5RDQ6_9CAUD|nr:hypothetical protein PP936_gp154 [Rhizobium phage RHph_I1_9]QIG69724.1 hypothetical protein EVB81_155 [Rhizobium phage RHph_I46]QIG71005.1 hypothetical protein EVB92_155 [Rhizobium phage RHph_I9]QIG73591.1 hypothetical protein EVC04_154 [Rhizobium phage RHph_I1_9]QIG76344.1 hypothetical protein EVC25_155 [Rhizobium phage RHph_I34]
MFLAGKEWPDTGPTEEEVRKEISTLLSNSISTGRFTDALSIEYIQESSKGIAELMIYFAKKTAEEAAWKAVSPHLDFGR